jgi:hypothetical protein
MAAGKGGVELALVLFGNPFIYYSVIGDPFI